MEEVDCGGGRVKVKEEKCEVCLLDKGVNDAHAAVHAVIVWMSEVKYAGHFDRDVMDACILMMNANEIIYRNSKAMLPH